MAGNFGVSFVPGGQAENNRDKVGQQASQAAQQAIQFLSLRLPRVTGAQGLAPAPLLNAPGGSGMPSGVIEALLRLAGMGGTPIGGGPVGAMPFQPPPQTPIGMPGAPGGGAPPPPRIVPGEQGPLTPPPTFGAPRPPQPPMRGGFTRDY